MNVEPKLNAKLNEQDIQTEIQNYQKRLLPFRILNIGSIVLFVLTILSNFFIGPGLLRYGQSIFFFLFILFALIFVSTILYNKRKNELKAFISEHITYNLLNNTFDVELYDHKRHIDEHIIKRLKLVRGWNRINGSDYVKGRYKGYPIEFSDILLEDVSTSTDANGNTKQDRTKIFEGPMIFLTHNRGITSPLVLRERQFLNNRGGSNIQTENVAFNKQFQIQCQDGHTAFLILTPHFMEYITQMDEKAHGTTYIHFGSGFIYLAINNNRNLFEASNRELQDISLLRARQEEDIAYLTGILDEIMKNEYLFKL